MLQWSEKFETGHPGIDSEHKSLIGYLNRLEDLARITNPSKAEVEFILNLVDFIRGYIRTHFSHEEYCMICHRCPAYGQNKAAHREFTEFFDRFQKRIEAEGFRHDLLQELYDTCHTWVQEHILKIDTQLRAFPPAGPENPPS